MRVLLGSEHDSLTGFELERCGQISNPDPGPLQVHEHGDSFPSAIEDGAKLMNPPGSDLGSSVGCIDAHHVDSCVEERRHLSRLIPRGAQGGNDLSAANLCSWHAGV